MGRLANKLANNWRTRLPHRTSKPNSGTLPRMNFIEDVMERRPPRRSGSSRSTPFGNRREWHFGELIARSAGLSGAMAARGVERGDAVMTLVGSRIEWVLAMLACFRMGAVAMPCNPQLRRKDLEVQGRGREPEALHRRGGAASASCPTASPR